MDEMERVRPPASSGGSSDQGGDALRAMRQQADALFAAGDEAIRRVLSSDSEAFLRANRQEGGE